MAPGGKKNKNLLPNHAIVQKPSVGLLPALDGIDRRPAPHLGRSGEDGAHDLEDEEFETGKLGYDFGFDPARVGVVDDDLALLGRGGGDLVGDFLDGVDFEQFGKVVSGFLGFSSLLGEYGDGWERGKGGEGKEFTYRPCWPSWGRRARRRCALPCARGISS